MFSWRHQRVQVCNSK